ncbi:zinc knuckle CX2CX4HX4C containing protein [Tanacetum coccineum]
MERGFLSSGGRGVKQKKGANTDLTAVNDIQHVVNAGTIPVSKIVDGASGKQADVRAELDKYPSLDSLTTGHASNEKNMGHGSFAKLFNANPTRKSVNFFTLLAPAGNGADVAISMESFSSKDRMYAMIENDSWLIRNVPFILNKWTPDANIMKEDVGNIPVWVKFHDIPVTMFSEDGTSSEAFVVVDDDGNPLKKVDDPVYADSDHSEVDEVFNETSLYEKWKETYKENPYNDDDFDDYGLTDAYIKFVNAFDISLRGQLR